MKQTFRLHSKRFYAKADSCCDLLICDEAHRLKNAETATNQALGALKCRRRILLSGTPMQNDLEEFYAMTDFTNPGVSECVARITDEEASWTGGLDMAFNVWTGTITAAERGCMSVLFLL